MTVDYKVNRKSEDRQSEYYKYLSKPVKYPEKKTVDNVFKTIIPNTEALTALDYYKLQNNGYHQYETGYSVFPDSTGYIAFHLDLPDITPEMFDWFYSWHPVETNRYRIWNPEEHVNAAVTEEDMIKLLNNNLSYNEKVWGINVLYREQTEEDGIHDCLMSYHSPYDFRFSEVKCTNWTAVCANDGSICHYVREKEGGSELRSRIWTGENTSDAEKEHSLPESFFSLEETEFMLKQTAYHFMTDLTNLSSVLPSLFKEYSSI